MILVFSCKRISNSTSRMQNNSKLKQIVESGVLRVVTDFNSTSYFIYRGQPMGFQYEMLQELADHLDVKLEVSVNNSLEEKFEMLERGDVDLIAVNLTVTNERRKMMDFTVPFAQTRQVLVQRKVSDSDDSDNDSKNSMVFTQLDLARKPVYVQSNSSYAKRLKNLSDEIGDTIFIHEIDQGVEKLIELVAEGEIDYTVADENVARVNSTYFDNIDFSVPVSFPQNMAWAVAKGTDDLRFAVNSWMEKFRDTRKYAVLYNKYFMNKRSAEIVESDYFANSSGKISPYDDIIKEYSKDIGWDWRLVASMMYQESRFNPEAVSWAGAYGLMQLMPNTGARFGIVPTSPEKKQIRAGIMFIQWLNEQLSDIKDEEERRKFILASYNVGLGHVLDARALAAKHGKDPNIWDDNVDKYLLSKSEPKYFTDSVVKYGYCRGIETYRYVANIVDRYEHYKNLVEE